MIGFPASDRVWFSTGYTDMRKGFDGLAVLVQEKLRHDPHGGHLFVFRGRRGSLIKVLWHDGQGMCLFAKRLERGRFISYGLSSVVRMRHRALQLSDELLDDHRSVRVRTPSFIDGLSNSHAGIGYPMMTVRRRAASFWPRT